MTSVDILETQTDPLPSNTLTCNPSGLFNKFIHFFSNESGRLDQLDDYKLTLNCVSRQAIGKIISDSKSSILLFYKNTKTLFQYTYIANNINQENSGKDKTELSFSEAEKTLQCECLYQLAIETINKEALKPKMIELLVKLGLKKGFRYFPSYGIDYQDNNFLGIDIMICNANRSSLDTSNKFHAEVRAEIIETNYDPSWNLALLSLRIIRFDNWDVVEIVEL